MNSINTLPYSSSPQYFYFTKCLHPQNSFYVKRRRSRSSRRIKPTKISEFNTTKRSLATDSNNDNQNLKLVLDVNQISSLTSSKFHRFLSLSEDAYYDLKTLIQFDDNNRLVFSCRKSTLQFTGAVLLCGFLLVSAIRVVINIWSGFRSRFRVSHQNLVVRRDRSLGGKEMVVAIGENEEVKRKKPRSLDNPLSPPSWLLGSGFGKDDWRTYRIKSGSKLPKWWPVSVLAAELDLLVDKQEYQREANRLIRAITDYRTSGKDVTEHDIIQVSFDTTNTWDAFYHASVEYVLGVCSSAPSYSNFIEIHGEEPKKFVAGLAENIGLENVRAARMVSAAVAALTRSSFLQAWALKVQGEHSEAELELSKICLVLRIFPPEESSPEMEMVAQGLGKSLKVEQREVLRDMFVSVCGKESFGSAADALGLMPLPTGIGDQEDIKFL